MQIKEMFRKEIDRELQGVIVVGQGAETNVAQELEEYVVTRELQRHFADFFAAYKKVFWAPHRNGRVDLRFLWKW